MEGTAASRQPVTAVHTASLGRRRWGAVGEGASRGSALDGQKMRGGADRVCWVLGDVSVPTVSDDH